MSAIAPSGEQFAIAFGEQRATIVEVGAGVREYAVGGRAVLEGYPTMRLRAGYLALVSKSLSGPQPVPSLSLVTMR